MLLSSGDANAQAGRKAPSESGRLMQHFRSGGEYEQVPVPAAPRRDMGLALLVVVCIAAIPLGAALGSPWPVPVLLRHLAAMPNCDMARLVDLAPAARATPGYWSWHDRDKDGIACEPWEGG